VNPSFKCPPVLVAFSLPFPHRYIADPVHARVQTFTTGPRKLPSHHNRQPKTSHSFAVCGQTTAHIRAVWTSPTCVFAPSCFTRTLRFSAAGELPQACPGNIHKSQIPSSNQVEQWHAVVHGHNHTHPFCLKNTGLGLRTELQIAGAALFLPVLVLVLVNLRAGLASGENAGGL